MNYTTNYNLKKPESTDFYNVADSNGNADIIDAELKKAENHRSNTSNPHGVTKSQVGLGNVNNTSDMDKPVSTAVQAALDNLDTNKLDKTGGTVNGTLSVITNVATPLTVKNTSSGNSGIDFNNSSGNLGTMGILSTGVPYVYLANVSSTYTLHHDGNSMRTISSQSQPSGDNILWVK